MHAQSEFHIPEDRRTEIPQTSKALSPSCRIQPLTRFPLTATPPSFFRRVDGWVSHFTVPLERGVRDRGCSLLPYPEFLEIGSVPIRPPPETPPGWGGVLHLNPFYKRSSLR